MGALASPQVWALEVIDLVWGRNDVLWPAVLGALRERPQRVLSEHMRHVLDEPGGTAVSRTPKRAGQATGGRAVRRAGAPSSRSATAELPARPARSHSLTAVQCAPPARWHVIDDPVSVRTFTTMTGGQTQTPLPASLASADLATVLEVYDRALPGLVDVDRLTGHERRELLSTLHARAAGPPAAIPGCPVVAAALLAFAASAQASSASQQWAAAALTQVGVTNADLAVAADALWAAAQPCWHRGVRECIPMANFRSSATLYRLVAVRDLPCWHNPKSDCLREHWLDHACELDTGSGLVGALRRRRRPAAAMPTWASALAAGRWVADQLAHGRVLPCARHVLSDEQVRSGAARAIRVWEHARPWTRHRALEVLAPAAREPFDPESAFAWSLLADPIVWVQGTDSVGNGQHRLCALRLAGVEHVLVS